MTFPRTRSILATDEQARAARFHFDPDRQRYMASRVALAGCSAQYQKARTAEIAFRYGPRGKPTAAGSIQFNVSHRRDYALLAFTRESEIGVDIEFVREVPEALIIARNHFTPAETRLLEAATAGPARQECFFRLWTRKEAVIKAVGTGLAMPLEQFDVTGMAPQRNDAWHAIHVPARPETSWAVRNLSADGHYRGALCVAGSGAPVSFWNGDDD